MNNRLLICAVLALTASAIPVRAQSGAGKIQGTVEDATGAVIPGASIRLLKVATGETSDTTANSLGFYELPSLFTGNYTITFSASAMKSLKTSLTLQVGQTAVVNPRLVVGAPGDTITVEGTAIQLVTYDGPTISSTLDNQSINQLPMNGRNLLTLSSQTTPGDEGNRVGGFEVQAMAFIQDGAPTDDLSNGGPVAGAPSISGATNGTSFVDPDAVQEVRVETSNSSARFSTPASTIVTTKSGTNQFHGTFFETARNNYIGIAKARQDPSNLVAPHLVRNEFGASVGGPISLPKIYNGINKSFFFFAYERYSLRQQASALGYVPTQQMQNGDFSQLQAAGVSAPVQLYDASTTASSTNCNGSGVANSYCRAPFSGNQIPISRISPLAKTLYPLLPLPSNASNPAISPNLDASAPVIQTAPTVTFRLDNRFNENNRAYLRYTSMNASSNTVTTSSPFQAVSIAAPGFPAGTFGERLAPTANYTTALGVTHIFSASFVSETTVSGQWENESIQGGGNPNVDYESELGLPSNFGPNSMQLAGTYQTYVANRRSYENSQVVRSLDENLTKIVGRHQMAFGLRYRYERQGIFPDATVNTTSFNGMATALLNPASGANYTSTAATGNANADFFLGAASNYNVNLLEKHLTYTGHEFDAYVQDDIHVNTRLTLNGGLRWEMHPALRERNLSNIGFDLQDHALVIANLPSQIARGATTDAVVTNLTNLGLRIQTPQQAGLPNTMVFDSNFTFGPRVGLACTLTDGKYSPVLRGGFGRYIFPIPYRNFYSAQASNSPYHASYNQSYTAASQSPDGLPDYILRSPQTVIAGQNSSNVVNTASTNSILPGGVSDTFLDPHLSPSYANQANVTFEQPIKGDAALRITYAYNGGSRLDQYLEFNYHPSTYVYEVTHGTALPTGTYASAATGLYDQTIYGNSLIEDTNRGYSTDNSLQLNVQHLFKDGYAYQAYYVYSRAYRVGGNGQRDSLLYPIGDFVPGNAPVSSQGLAPYAAPDYLNTAENYAIDTAIPEHRIGFNAVVDLPFGRGKRFFSHIIRFVDELTGGYQIAGAGTVLSQYFKPTATNFGGSNPIGGGSLAPVQIYKHAYPVNDCRSGVCYKEFQWFNGFIDPLVTENPCGSATISGLSGHLPYQTPVDMATGTVTCTKGVAKASNTNYLTNNVPVALSNGATVQVAYSPGPSVNPYTHATLRGPFNYNADISLFKVFPLNERVTIRINVDAFNAFNIQGYVNPDPTTGLQSLLTSYWTPRQLQFTARVTF
ncbi:MAG: carboxypeptidase regulatory-like domain-containing protein [Acidobacteriaceae bacterium]